MSTPTRTDDPAAASHAVAVRIDGRRVVVYHSLARRPVLVTLASAGDADRLVSSVDTRAQRPLGNEVLDGLLCLSDSTARRAAATAGDDYCRSLDGVPFLSLMTSESCNLGCGYCIAGTNMLNAREQRVVKMRPAVATRALDWFIDQAPDRVLHVNFSGGEPLVNWPTIRAALEYVSASVHPKAPSIRFSINTNAVLITESIAQTLAEHRVEIASSLDGRPEDSDLVRVTKSGAGVSTAVLAGWQRLEDAGHPVSGFLATFTDENIRGLSPELINWAAERGMTWVRVDCDVLHLGDTAVADVADRIWATYLRGQELGIAVEGFWSTAADNLLNRQSDGMGFFCGAVSGETLSVHPDGRISACGFSSQDLGRVTDRFQVNSRRHLQLVHDYTPGNRAFCRGCDIEGSCAGGCNIAREEAEIRSDAGAILFNCELYRDLTTRLLRYHFCNDSPARRAEATGLVPQARRLGK